MMQRSTRLTAIVFTGILFTVTACTAQQANPTYSPAIEQKIKQVESNLSGGIELQDSVNTFTLQQRMKENGINGVSIAVIHNYQLEWARGYGLADVADNTPATTKTLFQAASISKSLNGVGVMKLVQDKKIDLSADINTYLHTWKFPYDTVSRGKKISAANLLSHTGGLTVHGFAGYSKKDTIPSILQILNGQRPANSDPIRSFEEPGKRSVYSGGGITISQLIVTDITKQAYDAYMWKQVLQPMGMLSSSYTQPPAKDKQSRLATGYRGDGKPVEGNYHIYPEQAAAGLWTTPADLAAFITEIQLAYEGRSGKVLSAETVKQYVTPFIDASAGMGTFIMEKGGIKYFSHGGANEGYRCQYYGSLTGGNGVVVMVNSDNGRILNEIVNSVATVYQWNNFYTPEVRKAVAVPAELLNSYTGNYVLEKDTVSFSTAGGRYMLIVNGEERYPVYFTSPQDFFSPDLSFALKFETDAAGKVTAIYFKNNGGERRAKRL